MKIKSLRSIGFRRTFSPEMKSHQHNYLTDHSDAVHKNSHSVAYCLVAYACLWLKTYFPHEWWAAVMSHCHPEKLIRYMNSARADGYEFRSIHANNLARDFRAIVEQKDKHNDPSYGHIMPGLAGIKGIGDKAVETFVVPGAVYSSLADAVEKTGKQKSIYERLIKLGAFSTFPGHENIKACWMWYLYHYADDKNAKKEVTEKVLASDGWTEQRVLEERARLVAEFQAQFPKKKAIPKKVTDWKPVPSVTIEKLCDIYEDFSLDEILETETAFLGYTIHSPLEKFVIKGGCSINEAKETGELEAVVVNCTKTRTKTEKAMAKLVVTDGLQTCLVMIWHDRLSGIDNDMFRPGTGLRLFVKYDFERNNFSLNSALLRLRLKKSPHFQDEA